VVLALSSIFSLLTSQATELTTSSPGSVANVKIRKLIESFVYVVISTFPPSSASSFIIQQGHLLVSLLLARQTFVNDPSDILSLAIKIADILRTDPINPQKHEAPVARILDVHLYTLTGLTLLELIDSEDADLVKPAQEALSKVRHATEQVSERVHARRQSTSEGGPLTGVPELHWADALLRLIDAKGGTDQGQRPSQSTTSGELAASKDGDQPATTEQVNGNSEAKEPTQIISPQQQYLISRLTNVAAVQNTIRANGTKMTVVDFSLLTRSGYLNVLADLNGF
jgi:hypothetical protein